MRILWVSAKIFDEAEEKQSGVWQKAMALKLVANPEIVLANVSYQGITKQIYTSDFKGIKQYGLPRLGKLKKGYPPSGIKVLFRNIVNEFKPDIIHIWGSENPLKLLAFDKNYAGVKVLSMQGVLSSIAENLLNGLSFWQILSTIGIRELLKGSSLFSKKKSFYKDGFIEQKIIKSSDYIIAQSDWTVSQIKSINPNAKFFKIDRVLRPAFVKADKWTSFNQTKPVIYSAAVGYSLKGLHVLIKAFALVKDVIPNVELKLAGAVGRTDFLGDGYLRLIHRMINKLELQNNVKWLGAIPANEIVHNLQQASVFVNPSFIESYSLVLAEAMAVGTPSVISFAGAMPELAENNKEALFFSPGDYRQCAYQIIKLLSNRNYAVELSVNARNRSQNRNADTVLDQVAIYKAILANEENS